MNKFSIFTSSLLIVSLSEPGYSETCRNKLSGIHKSADRINLIYNRDNEYTMTSLDQDWNVVGKNKKLVSFRPREPNPSTPSTIVIGPASPYGQPVVVPAPAINGRPFGHELDAKIGHGLSFFSDEDGDLVGVNVANGKLTMYYFRRRVDSYSGKLLINRTINSQLRTGDEHFKHKGNLQLTCNGIDFKSSDIVTAAGNINSTHVWIALRHESDSDGQIRTGLVEMSLNSYEDSCNYHRFKRIIDDVHAFHLFDQGEDVLLVYHDSFMTITRNELKGGVKSKDRLSFFQCRDFESQLIGHVLKYARKDAQKPRMSIWKIVAISIGAIIIALSAIGIVLCLRRCCSCCNCI